MHIIIGAASGIALLLLSVIGIYMYKRHKLWKRIANDFENQPLQKTNREYDAFVSYTYEASINFIKNTFSHYFKLDFHGATLIIQNISDGTQKSNCAIVLVSQEYMDAPWYRGIKHPW